MNISGVTIRNGNVVGVSESENTGGGIYNRGSLTLTDSNVNNNTANWSGGGLYNDQGSEAVLTNVVVSGNTARDVDYGSGGGICNSVGDLTLISVTVSENSAGHNGGGIENTSGSYWGVSFTANGLTVHNNSAGWNGGGIYAGGDTDMLDNVIITDNTCGNYGGGIWGIPTLTNFTITGNQADGGGGIAVIGGNTIALTLTNGVVNNNSAVVDGGGIKLAQWATAIVDRVTISGNEAGHGGGIDNGDGSILTLTNSTVSGNEAVVEGGGINNEGLGPEYPGSTPTATLTNVTISGNFSDSPFFGFGAGLFNRYGSADLINVTIVGNRGGVYYGAGSGIRNEFTADGVVTVKNSIITDNTWKDGSTEDNCSGTITSNGYNISNICFSPPLSTDLMGVDPVIGPLTDNGGPTYTHALLTGSPAIDAADPDSFPPTDQRNIARPQGARADIGAFEFVSSANPVPDIAVSLTAMDFGTIAPGASKQVDLTVSNLGQADLILGSIGVADALMQPFTITGSTCSGQILSPGGSCTFGVTFSPDGTNTYSDTFDIPSNDPEEPSVTISVQGDGSETVAIPALNQWGLIVLMLLLVSVVVLKQRSYIR